MEKKATELEIKKAAKRIFLQRGFAGTRMQEIANEAGINKAMLHYYYRSKQKLFEVIFDEALGNLLPQLSELISAKGSMIKKIEKFITLYIDTIRENPHLPLFVMHELSSEPEKFVGKLKARTDFSQILLLTQQVQEGINKGEIKSINPIHLFINVISMCAFPFIARPIIKTVTQMEDKDFDLLMENRKKEVIQFVRNAIKP